MRKNQGKFATPPQTRRWVKCLEDWAKRKGKSGADICEVLGYANKSSWSRLRDGTCSKVRIDTLQLGIAKCGLNTSYINGYLDYKNKFTEARNIFTDFKQTYATYIVRGQYFHAAQIVRKAAMFIYETLVPKDMALLHLSLENRLNNYESAKVTASVDGNTCYTVSVFGDSHCIKFTMVKKLGSSDVPVMEGDLDVHAVSAIKRVFVHTKKTAASSKRSIAKFTDNANRLTQQTFKS